MRPLPAELSAFADVVRQNRSRSIFKAKCARRVGGEEVEGKLNIHIAPRCVGEHRRTAPGSWQRGEGEARAGMRLRGENGTAVGLGLHAGAGGPLLCVNLCSGAERSRWGAHGKKSRLRAELGERLPRSVSAARLSAGSAFLFLERGGDAYRETEGGIPRVVAWIELVDAGKVSCF